jgi:hypothetical protein
LEFEIKVYDWNRLQLDCKRSQMIAEITMRSQSRVKEKVWSTKDYILRVSV